MPSIAAPTDPLKGTAWGDLQPTDYSKLAGYVIRAELFGLDGYAGPFLIGSVIPIPKVQTTTTDHAGRWAMELYGNDEILPAGSYWQITQADSVTSSVLELAAGTSINIATIVDDDFPTGGSFTPPRTFFTASIVRAATTANITIATALNNGDTLDGLTLATGDRVLVKDQSSAAQNGVYVVGVTPARSTDFNAWSEFPGAVITVSAGTANAGSLWRCTAADGGTLDTTAIPFSSFTAGTSSASWGSITGTLADQTDLQAALDEKYPLLADEPCSTSVDPATLTWTQRSEGHDAFDLISPGFAIPDITAAALRIPVSILTSAGSGSIAVTGATMDITVAGGYYAAIAQWEEPPAAYWAAEAHVYEMPATSGVVVVGIWKDASNHLGCYYDGTDIKFDITIGGSQTIVAGLTIALTAPFKLACVQTQNYLAAFYDSGAGWVLAAITDISALVNLATDSVRLGYHYYWQFNGTGVGKLSRFRAGIWGGSASSSHYLVTYEDGTPIWSGRDVFFVATVGGVQVSADNNYGPSHLAVMRWNVDTDVHSVVSHIFTSRSSKTLGDCYGPLLYDRDTACWRIFPQNCGDMTLASYGAGAETLMGTSAANLIAGVHVVAVANLPLPSGSYESYDAALIKLSGVWYAGYTEVNTNRYPALATTSDIDGAWTQVAIDTAQHLCEGARWVKFGTAWRLLYSKINGGVSSIRQYTTALADQGGFTPTGWPQNTAIGGHPMIFGVPTTDGKTKWRALTFDDTPWTTGQTWGYGNYLTFNAAEKLTGYVFDTPTTQEPPALLPPVVPAAPQTDITGNAATATALQTARAINGVSFDGTAAITVTAAAGTLTGTTLASNVVSSSLTSVGTLGVLSVTGDISIGEGSAISFATGASGNFNLFVPTGTTANRAIGFDFPLADVTYVWPNGGATTSLAQLGANTFTTLQTITQANANTGILASTGYSLTGSNATNMLSFAGTWNTSGNPTALRIAITNTASGSTAKFLEFLAGAAGATSVFSVDKAGAVTAASIISGSAIYFSGTTGSTNGQITTTGGITYLDFPSVINFRDSGSAYASVSFDAGGINASGARIDTPQSLSGAGAVNVTTVVTEYTSTGAAQALTLANGTVGQIKEIIQIVDGGSGILTPTTKTGYTTITFTNAGDSVRLRYCTTAGWCVVGSFGVVIA